MGWGESYLLELPIHPTMRHHERRAVWDGGSHVYKHVNYLTLSDDHAVKLVCLCRRPAGPAEWAGEEVAATESDMLLLLLLLLGGGNGNEVDADGMTS